MQTATMARVFALFALSSYPVSAGDWNSLDRFSRLRTVKVHLKNGQEMKGTIQQVEPESLQLASEKSRIHVSVKELAGAIDKAQVGQIVELTTRGGESLKGTLHEANQYYIYLDETKSAVRIPRDEIQPVGSVCWEPPREASSELTEPSTRYRPRPRSRGDERAPRASLVPQSGSAGARPRWVLPERCV